MRTTIARILSIEKKGDLFITTIIDSDGNEATGVGKDFCVGDLIFTFFDDRYNRVKFQLRT